MQVVRNFNKHLNGARIAWNPHHLTAHDLYIDIVGGMEGQFFMDSDKVYNTSDDCKHLHYVFFVTINWDSNSMTIGIVRKGEGTKLQESWSAPINRDIMKTPANFLTYLRMCVEQKEIMTAYFNK
jgi:hypothetical protein